MTDVTQRIECQWCHAQSPASARSCDTCGAPLDIKNLVSDSGWREAPRLRDMTEIHFGDSVFQVEREIVRQGDGTYSLVDPGSTNVTTVHNNPSPVGTH